MGVHYHQSSTTRNVKGTSLRKGKKNININNKMTTYLSITTLNVNEIYASIQRVAENMTKTHTYFLKETHTRSKETNKPKVKG